MFRGDPSLKGVSASVLPKQPKLLWTFNTEDEVKGSIVVVGDKALFGSVDGPLTVVGGCDAVAHIIDLGSGEKIGGVEVGSPIAGSMAMIDGQVYFGHYGEEVLALDVKTQKQLWKYEDRKFAYFSTPAVTADRVIIGGRDKRIHCLNRKDGSQVWQFKTRGAVDSSPVVSGDAIVCGSDDGFLYLIDLATGEERWSFEIGEPVQGSPAVAQGRIFIGSLDGSVYCFGSE